MKHLPGTLELFAIELYNLLQPLEERLAVGEVRRLFAELGMEFPPELEVQSNFTDAIEHAVTDAVALSAIITELNTALQSENLSQIIQKTNDLINAITALLDDIDEVATQLNSLPVTLPGILPTDLADFANQLPRRLLAYLLIIYLEENAPGLNEFLEFWHIIERTEEQLDSGNPAKPPYTNITLHLNRLIDFLQSPAELAQTLYSWGLPTFDGVLLLERLNKLFASIGIPVFHDTASVPPRLNMIVLELSPKTDISPPGLVLLAKTTINEEVFNFEQDDWRLNSGLLIPVLRGTEFIIQPDRLSVVPPPSGHTEGEIFLRVIGTALDPTLPFSIFGQAEGTRLQALEFKTEFKTQFSLSAEPATFQGIFLFEAAIKQGELFINPAGADAFLTQILPSEGIKAEFDITIGLSREAGFYFHGSSALEISLPVHVAVGPVEFQSITIRIRPGDGKLPIDLGGDVKIGLGPVTAVIKNLGLNATFSFPKDNSGNLGLLQLDLGFKYPEGLGIAINGGGFKGGGSLAFEPDNDRYTGHLELVFKDKIDLKAIGLLTTKLPGGKEGFSLLIIITAEFSPVQLGFGFTLNGVGGLLGLNRTAKIERLRTGVKDNTLSSILFPTDIIANADRIISDLRQVFPPQEGRFIFGPMVKIAWGTPPLITIDLGLMIEVPDPVRLVILGVVKAVLPDEKAGLLRLQVNFLGVIDFEKKQLSFDASLFDSKLLAFPLSGDMAIRLNWGNDPNFLLTVGGFHPAYEPPPMNLPNLRRLTLQLLKGNNPRLTLETYFAVTSNTAQFGAKLELYAAKGRFNIYGFLSFDALFRFNPFYFIADVSAMLALRSHSKSIASIKLDLTLEGTTPWKAHGTAKLKLFWFLTVKIRFNKTFGEERDTTLPAIEVIPLLEAALSASGNWQPQIPGRSHLLVSLKQVDAAVDTIIAHPFGILEISQKVVPLNIPIDKFGNQKPGDGNEFHIQNVKIGTRAQVTVDTEEFFAPAQFFEKTDLEKLSGKSFEKYDSGIRIASSEKLNSDYYSKRDVEYELFYIDSQRDRRLFSWFDLVAPDAGAFNSQAVNGAIADSDLSFAKNAKSALAPDKVAVGRENFAVVNTIDLTVFDETSVAKNEEAARYKMEKLLQDNPALEGSLQVVPQFEVNVL